MNHYYVTAIVITVFVSVVVTLGILVERFGFLLGGFLPIIISLLIMGYFSS